MRHDGAVHIQAGADGQGTGHFQRHDGIVRKIPAPPAIGLRNSGTQQAQCTEAVPDLPVHMLLLGPLHFLRDHFVLDEAPRRVLEKYQVLIHPR